MGRNHYWFDICPKHGRQAHQSYLGGRCEKCHQEGLEAQGLVGARAMARGPLREPNAPYAAGERPPALAERIANLNAARDNAARRR